MACLSPELPQGGSVLTCLKYYWRFGKGEVIFGGGLQGQIIPLICFLSLSSIFKDLTEAFIREGGMGEVTFRQKTGRLGKEQDQRGQLAFAVAGFDTGAGGEGPFLTPPHL